MGRRKGADWTMGVRDEMWVSVLGDQMSGSAQRAAASGEWSSGQRRCWTYQHMGADWSHSVSEIEQHEGLEMRRQPENTCSEVIWRGRGRKGSQKTKKRTGFWGMWSGSVIAEKEGEAWGKSSGLVIRILSATSSVSSWGGGRCHGTRW